MRIESLQYTYVLLGVLCASVVNACYALVHQGDTEEAEECTENEFLLTSQ
jgi:hypothetical protein